MTGPMGGGSADRPKTPPQQKQPDKPPVPAEVPKQPPPDVPRPADKQQDGKANTEKQEQATPQPGKPADVAPRPSGDAAARQSGDTAGKQPDGPRQSGDAPKNEDGGKQPGDVPAHPGDQHPGWHQTADFGQWRDQSQSLWQPRPDGRPASGPAEGKGAPQHGDHRSERFTHRLNLDDCRSDSGKLDREKLKERLAAFAGADRQERTTARLHDQHQGTGVSARPMEMTVRIEHARSYVDVREVDKAMQSTCDKFRFVGRVEFPGRPPADFRPGSVPRSDSRDRPPVDSGAIRQHQEGVQPRAVRPVIPPAQPPSGGRPGTPRGW